MLRKFTLLFLSCIVTVISATAQRCATDQLHQQMMANDPAYASLYNAGMAMWANHQAAIANNPIALKQVLPSGDSVYEIPVVVHILHTGGPVGSIYNPTDTRIINTINYVNQAFQATWASYPAVGNGGTRIALRFALAKRNPNCGISDGIVRVNAATTLGNTYTTDGVFRSSSGVSDAAVKGVSIWPRTEYYNIWVVNKIDGKDGTSGSFIAGYAMLPPGSPTLDGTVMLATQFDINRITLVHELGHAMGLLHTFDGSSSPSTCPPSTNDCTVDNDGICDTDPNPQTGPGSCPVAPAINPCTGFAYGNESKNFMNYSNCQDRFTAGQADRMMFSFEEFRPYYISSLGATTISPLPTVACVPALTNPNPANNGPARVRISKTSGSVTETFLDFSSGGYTADGNVAYIDNTCKHRATLTSGVSYTMTVERAGFQQEQVRVYLDYNNDGDFTDPGETLFSGNTGFSNSISFNFTPPLAGISNCIDLRLRVRSDRSSSSVVLNSCNNHDFGQTEDYAVLVKGAGTSSGIANAVSQLNPPRGGNPTCFNDSLTFVATPLSTVSPIWYRWFKKSSTGVVTTKGIGGASDTTWGSRNFNNLDTVWVAMAYPGPCGVDTARSDSIVVKRQLSIMPAVTIGITKGTNPGCIEDTIRFTVISNVNPGGNPGYIWHFGSFVRDTVFGSPHFDTFGIANNTDIYVEMLTSVGPPCAPVPIVSSNIIKFTHTTRKPTAIAALTNGTNPGCAGQTLTFTAITTYGGASPSYQWKLNGNNAGTNSPTFSGVFNDGDVITYVLTSSSSCVLPADNNITSNSVTIQHAKLTADIQIGVVNGTNVACQGHPVVFSANTTGSGTNPDYEWLLNGTPIANTNSPVYSSSSLATGDQISCVLIATDPCVDNERDTSNVITMQIIPSAIPSVTIAITSGKNPWCLDSLVEFTATPQNAGTNPNFEWLVNGFPTYNGPVFPNDAYLNGDLVICRLNPTDGACYLPDTVYSAPVTMIRSTLPDPPVIHLVGNMLITNKAGTYRWWGPAGLYTNGTNGTFHPTEKGLYMAVTDNNGCWSLPSNYLQITLLDISTTELPTVDIYPNPTNGELVLDWGSVNVTMHINVINPMGQTMMNDKVENSSSKTLNLSALPNGIYHIVLQDEHGNSGYAKITLTR